MAFYLLIFAGIIFVVLAVLVRYHNIWGLDIFLSHDLQAEGDTPERRTIIYQLLYCVSLFGKPLIAAAMVIFFAVIFWLYKYYREAVYVLFTPLAALVNSIVKIIVDRPRPTANFVQILATETDTSFPSGHVNFYTVFFGFLFACLFFVPRIPKFVRYFIQIISIFLIVAISFSRVYLGVHWVSDTIGGYLLGLLILVVLLFFYLRYLPDSHDRVD